MRLDHQRADRSALPQRGLACAQACNHSCRVVEKNDGDECYRSPAELRRAGDCRMDTGERKISDSAGEAVRTEKAGVCVERVVYSRHLPLKMREYTTRSTHL